MTVQVAPTAIDRSIARRRQLPRQHQSLRAGAPVASGSSARWRTGIMPEAWQRPLPDAGIDGVELSLRPPNRLWLTLRKECSTGCTQSMPANEYHQPKNSTAIAVALTGVSKYQ